MKQGRTRRAAARLVIAGVVAIGFAGAAAGPAAASRRCTVKVGWYGWAGQIKEDTCSNWVEITADCSVYAAGSNVARTVGAWVKVAGWLTFATSCEAGKYNMYPFTYLFVHHYDAGWDQVAVDGPFSPSYQVVKSTFTEA